MDCEELGRFWFEHGVPTCTGRRFAFGVPSGFANRRVRDGELLSQGHHDLGNDLREALAA